MRSAEVVIIGAGVLGCSAAYHLAVRGCKEIVVLDRAPSAGMGSTGKATGGFRSQFGSEINIRLSLLSRDKLLRFSEEIGVDPQYIPAGYLVLAEEDSAVHLFREAVKLQQRVGLSEVREIAAEELR